MLTIQGLKEFGANTEEGLQRCMGNEAFYLRFVGMVTGDAGFEKLYSSIEAGDLKNAFEAAHALKGVLGNLSLTPIYDPVCEITEHLRAGEEMDYTEYVDKIRDGQNALRAMMEN